MNYSSVSQIKEVLNSDSLVLSKKFGQNFLISESVLSHLADLTGVCAGKKIWEIGPGIGALTSLLIKRGANLTCFEIDYGFVRVLKEQAFPDERIKVVSGDFIKEYSSVLEACGVPDVICGNLPYNVGATAIASLVKSRCISEKMVFTLQSEVVDRICAKPSDSEYSSFTLLLKPDYEAERAFGISADLFWPEPKVESSVVVLNKRKESLLDDRLFPYYSQILRAVFTQRRKKIRNSLRLIFNSESDEYNDSEVSLLLEKSGVSGDRRPQELDFEDFIKMAKIYGSEQKRYS